MGVKSNLIFRHLTMLLKLVLTFLLIALNFDAEITNKNPLHEHKTISLLTSVFLKIGSGLQKYSVMAKIFIKYFFTIFQFKSCKFPLWQIVR